MKRLFVFGCSFTAYGPYPGWSDFLALHYEQYQNWAVPGIGNRGIFERLTECHVKHNIGPDDLVIIQWTSHLRHDWHYPKHKMHRPLTWKTYGSVFAPINKDLFNDKWIDTFFDEGSWIMHSLNYMSASQALLKSTGATWYMTTIADWCQLGTDMIDTTTNDRHSRITNPLRPKPQIAIDYPQYQPYVEHIWDQNKDRWLDPIALHADRTPELRWAFEDPKKDMNRLNKSRRYYEPHPSPRQHALWLEECLLPRLGLQTHPDQEAWLQGIDQAYSNSKTIDDLGRFMTQNAVEGHVPRADIWPTPLQGF